MAFEEDPDDERPPASSPLPPEDRLWRHPSEVASSAGANTWAVRRERDRPNRGVVLAALISAMLAGAVVAAGVMWVARPTRVVVREARPAGSAADDTASFARTPVSAGALAERYAPSLATVAASRDGTWIEGTGIWLDDRGTVVVPTALVAHADQLEIQSADGTTVEASEIQLDDATGITILQAADAAGEPIAADRGQTRPGEVVAAIAAAAPGHDGLPTQEVMTAAVSDTGARCAIGDWVLHDGIELDRVVPDEVTGSILVDGDGSLVGIVLSGQGGNAAAVAVPADQAIEAAILLRDKGSVPRAWLGVRATDVDDADGAGASRGALLSTVQSGSPADGAGLQEGDVITQIGDRSIADASDLVVALRDAEPGELVTITWRRDGTVSQAEVILGG